MATFPPMTGGMRAFLPCSDGCFAGAFRGRAGTRGSGRILHPADLRLLLSDLVLQVAELAALGLVLRHQAALGVLLVDLAPDLAVEGVPAVGEAADLDPHLS